MAVCRKIRVNSRVTIWAPMLYRPYGRTGVEVSQLGFGCMRLPVKGRSVRRAEAVRILRRGIDLGINYLDTAFVYHGGESETVLGEAVRDRRDRVYISTKNHYKGDDPKEWRSLLDRSLERLGTDYVDFYHIHGLSLEEYAEHLLPSGSMDEALRARDEGTIEHLCFSSHDDPDNIIKLIDTGSFEGILVQYNLFDRHNEKAISYAREQRMGVSIMGTVGGGQLIPASGRIRDAADIGESVPELAIRFVLSNPGVSTALSGMGSMKMVEENVAAASRGEILTPAELELIGSLMEEVQRLQGLYCSGCGYCMPCPSGVDIPANFAAYNLSRVWGMSAMAKIQYKALGDRMIDGERVPAWASACTECGSCVEKCPQNIAIPDRLKDVSRAFED